MLFVRSGSKKGDTEALQNNLRQIVPHTFGEHTGCGAWCKYNDLLEVHSRNSHRLSPNSSTNANESFNTIVASKCLKNTHYSSSESFNFRLAAAAAQKNRGKKFAVDTRWQSG